MSPARKPTPPHVLLVSYLFPPNSRSGAQRTAAFRNALEGLGIRTTVLTSTVSGRSTDDKGHSVARAKDARSAPSLQGVVGSDRGRRWWSRLIVPDATVLSWGPAAAKTAMSILRHDRPDVVFTSSPPESVHVLGLLLSGFGVPWVADFRDGWTFEPPTLRPYLTGLDGALERLVISRAKAVTAATAPLAHYLRTRMAIALFSISRTASTLRLWQPPPPSTARSTPAASLSTREPEDSMERIPGRSYALSRSRSQSSRHCPRSSRSYLPATSRAQRSQL